MFTIALGCTGVNGHDNIKNIRKIQDRYLLTPLQSFTAGISVRNKKIDALAFTGKIGNRKDGWVAVVNPPIFGPEEVMKGKYIVQAFAAQ